MHPDKTQHETLLGLIDRLVDGNLTETERHDLILRLDREENAWRSCAVAFLEAQAWRDSFSSILNSKQPIVRVIESVPRKSNLPLQLRWVAAAAVVMIAFLLGRATMGSRGSNLPSQSESFYLSANDKAPVKNFIDDPITPDDKTMTKTKVGLTEDSSISQVSPEIQEIGYLQLPTTNEPDSPIVRLPVLAGPGLNEQWLRDQPTFVPEIMRRTWEQQGYDVASQRRLVSVQMNASGRYLTIPVDEVRLRLEKQDTY